MADEPLNPGIVRTVEWLRGKGFETTDSGDGETHSYDCDLAIPYVHMVVHPGLLVAEADRLAAELKAIGIEPDMLSLTHAPFIQASYDPCDKTGVISLLGVTDKNLP